VQGLALSKPCICALWQQKEIFPTVKAGGGAMTTHVPRPDEIVPAALRTHLRWDQRHDAMAARIIKEFDLKLPRDRELIRQLTLVRAPP
jgi:hypothetical protein